MVPDLAHGIGQSAEEDAGTQCCFNCCVSFSLVWRCNRYLRIDTEMRERRGDNIFFKTDLVATFKPKIRIKKGLDAGICLRDEVSQ